MNSTFLTDQSNLQKELEKCQKDLEKCLEIKDFLSTNFSNFIEFRENNNPNLDKLNQHISFLENETNQKFEFIPNHPFLIGNEPLLLSKEDIQKLIELQVPYYDPKIKKLLIALKSDNVIKSDLVFNTMMIINRRNFVPENLKLKAHQDNPMSIGWNTTISAPHMHAMTLEELKFSLQKAKRALDIGSGSGYMTACMAEIMGPNTQTIGIDHIDDIVKFSIENVRKKNAYLLENDRLKFVTCDGRKGFKDNMPYDVIHVGGAVPNVPKELEEQLACGGKMWIPVGPPGRQSINLIEKDEKGKIKTRKVLDVAYGPLTSVENQLNPGFG